MRIIMDVSLYTQTRRWP